MSLGAKQAADMALLNNYDEKSRQEWGCRRQANGKSWSLAHFPDLSHCADLEPTVSRGARGLRGRTLQNCNKYVW